MRRALFTRRLTDRADGVDWHDLIVVAVDHERGLIEAREVFRKVRRRKGGDAVVGVLVPGHHALQPEALHEALVDGAPVPIEAEERAPRDSR